LEFKTLIEQFAVDRQLNCHVKPFAYHTPSKDNKNSVFILRMPSCSFSFLSDNNESTSSMKIIEGCMARATPNNALTIFSPSPSHFDVREEALMLKKVAFDSAQTALA
jgi:hypothetical protein